MRSSPLKRPPPYILHMQDAAESNRKPVNWSRLTVTTVNQIDEPNRRNRTGWMEPNRWNRTGHFGHGHGQSMAMDMAMDCPWPWTWPWTVHGHGHGHGREPWDPGAQSPRILGPGHWDPAGARVPGIPGPGALGSRGPGPWGPWNPGALGPGAPEGAPMTIQEYHTVDYTRIPHR